MAHGPIGSFRKRQEQERYLRGRFYLAFTTLMALGVLVFLTLRLL